MIDVNRREAVITIAIPTFGREQALINTVEAVLRIAAADVELIVIDQTPKHTCFVALALATLVKDGAIRLIQLPEPSIPKAMNIGLTEALGEIVLFLDDDVIPEPDLIRAHLAAHSQPAIGLVAGRVIQPWQENIDFSNDTNVHFASLRSGWIDKFIGCNFSIRRDLALRLGGFDENFVKVAYNFEAEFAYRVLQAGYKIYFEPRACLHHKKVSVGGTRSFGEHLKTLRPDHAVGAYYHTLRTWSGSDSFKALLRRPLSAIATRHHLRRPWWIPLTLIGEVRGFIWALKLAWQGPVYCAACDKARSGN